jgi:hypothetical protein
MEPLKPRDLEQARSKGATEAELAEYNRLIAERFTTNPNLAKSPADERIERQREQKIGDLYQKLFSPVQI